MKGLVLAGGSGTRLRPLTYTGAKQLVPVANRPVLFYVIDNLVHAGVQEIGIIISPQTGDEIREALGNGDQFGAQLTYIVQDKPAGLAHAVATARPFLGDDDFVMYLGDNLIGDKIEGAVKAFAADDTLGAWVMLKEVEDPTRFGVAVVGEDGDVVSLVEKPKVPPSNLALVGIYIFRKTIFDAIDQIEPSARGELEITDAICKLIELDRRVRFNRIDAWWLDTGKKDDMLLANDTVLDDWLERSVEGTVDEASELVGRVRVEPGAVVERSTIRGPVVIGRDARIVDALIGPFTSIGDGVSIERSRVDHSVIMEGSSVVDIARLEDSLIGKRVRVRPSAARHGALALMVGDDCVVEPTSRG